MPDEFDNSTAVSIESTSDGPSESVPDCEGGSSDDPAAPAGWQRRRRGWIAVARCPSRPDCVRTQHRVGEGLEQPEVAPSPLIGKPSPSFVLKALDDGPPVDSAGLAGQVVVINFWASWCVPCREEASTLQRFAQRTAGTGVQLIGVLYSDTRSNALDFGDEFGLTYPLVDDPDGKTAIDFGVRGIPETFIIGPDGRVRARLIGAVGPTTLDDVIRQVLAGQTDTSKNDQYRTGPNPSATTP